MQDSPPSDSPSKRVTALKSRKVRVGLTVAGAVAAVGAAWWLISYQLSGKYFQETDNAYVSADSVIVAPKVGGYVDQVLVKENQQVTAGEPLVQLDVREFRAQESHAEAQINAVEASTEAVKAQIEEQRAGIEEAKSQLAAAEADLALAEEQVHTYEPLVTSGAEPRERLRQLKSQETQARARVNAGRAGVLAAQRRIITLGEQVQQSSAQANAARAQLSNAKLNVEYTLVKASTSGRIGNLTVRQGQFVQPGTRLMNLVPVDQLFVEANFKETQLGLIRVGQPVRIELDAFSDFTLEGKVESIAPGTGAQFSILPPQNATGNFTKIVQRVPVRISISASPEVYKLLVPGMSVVATVDTRSAKNQLSRIRKAEENKR